MFVLIVAGVFLFSFFAFAIVELSHYDRYRPSIVLQQLSRWYLYLESYVFVLFLLSSTNIIFVGRKSIVCVRLCVYFFCFVFLLFLTLFCLLHATVDATDPLSSRPAFSRPSLSLVDAFFVRCFWLFSCQRAMPVEVTPFCWEHTLNTVKNLPSIKVRIAVITITLIWSPWLAVYCCKDYLEAG